MYWLLNRKIFQTNYQSRNCKLLEQATYVYPICVPVGIISANGNFHIACRCWRRVVCLVLIFTHLVSTLETLYLF